METWFHHKTELVVGDLVSEESSKSVFHPAAVQVCDPGQVSWLWKMRMNNVPNAPNHRDTKKMSLKHIYLLGDRHYVNKVKFLLLQLFIIIIFSYL